MTPTDNLSDKTVYVWVGFLSGLIIMHFLFNDKSLMSKNWLIITVTILILGVSFRVANVGNKIFWVDEVATITRIVGYTRSQILSEVQEQDIIYASDLLKYQKLNSQKSLSDTIKALIKSPEHAPLYFILARFWIQLFGDSIITLRSLSIIFGLLCLPSIYFLSQELFSFKEVFLKKSYSLKVETKKKSEVFQIYSPHSYSAIDITNTNKAADPTFKKYSQTASIISLLLLSISPFYVAYAQEARPYSLWIFLIFINYIFFLKSLKWNNNLYWYSYLVTTILNLYTSLFSWFILISSGCYLILLNKKFPYALKKYLKIVTASFITFIPWIWVIINYWHQLQDNTSWMDEPMKIAEMATVWVASILLIFGNLPLSPDLDLVVVVGILVNLILLLLIILGIYYLTKKSYAFNYKILGSIAITTITILFILIKVSANNLPLKAILNPTPIIGITTAFGLLFLVFYSLFFIYNRAFPEIKYFVLSLFFIPTSILIISDLILQDQRSATPRYLIPAQLAIILMVTYLLSQKINSNSKIAKSTLSGLLILGIVSCSLTWQDSPQFQKSRNYHNPNLENIINQQKNPLIISDSAQIMDLLSMSHNLKSQVMIKLFASNEQILSQEFSHYFKQNVFIFNPNKKLIESLKERDDIVVREIYKPHLRIPGEIYLSLWSVI